MRDRGDRYGPMEWAQKANSNPRVGRNASRTDSADIDGLKVPAGAVGSFADLRLAFHDVRAGRDRDSGTVRGVRRLPHAVQVPRVVGRAERVVVGAVE